MMPDENNFLFGPDDILIVEDSTDIVSKGGSKKNISRKIFKGGRRKKNISRKSHL